MGTPAPSIGADDAAIEKEIQAKGLNAPRLTPDRISGVIAKEDYIVLDGTTMTICWLTLKNGYIVTGESAAASKENFDPEIGRKIARTKAVDKIWALEGYLLKQKIYDQLRTLGEDDSDIQAAQGFPAKD
jgi:hypothetical protein